MRVQGRPFGTWVYPKLMWHMRCLSLIDNGPIFDFDIYWSLPRFKNKI